MEKIGIFGSGQVARTLGTGFVRHGYAVMLGSRDTAKLVDWRAKAGENANVGSFEDAAAFGDCIVLAVKGTAAEGLVKATSRALKDKVVIDTTNPIADVPPDHNVIRFFTSPDESLMERLQDIAPDARFVKAFNSVGNLLMVDPSFPGTKPTMFICGNDASARSKVGGILAAFGWDVEDMGTAHAARTIENLCILWCIPGFMNNSWTHAFKLLKR
jgi:predicted dinucleotide-binding enzyme